MPPCRALLWIDCTAGAVVGAVTLSASGWLSGWLGLPVAVLWITGAANVTYACYSFSLAVRTRRSTRAVLFLVLANGVWPLCCIRWIVLHADTLTPLGMAHLLAEAAVVGGLAVLEWRCRAVLVGGGPIETER